MKLIVGLGNPGQKYDQTRHNIGFMVAAKVAALISASPSKTRFEGEFAEGTTNAEKLMVLCPSTYMNASGQSVRKAVDFFKLELKDVLIICDDLNLDSGRLRFRPRGSAGGQNGLKDIIRHLGSDEFPRLRLGIGRPPAGWTVTDYVLGKFSKAEQDKIELSTTRAAHGTIQWAVQGIGSAMNDFNASPTPKKKKEKSKTKADVDHSLNGDNATESNDSKKIDND